MAKWAVDSLMDLGLGILMTSKLLAICSQQPATKGEACGSYGLAFIGVTSASFTFSDDTSGRKITCAAVSSIGVNSSGNANHIALCTSADLLLVTTCTSQVLTAGNSVATPAFKDGIADPA